MVIPKKAVFFFCAESIDFVAPHVFLALTRLFNLHETALVIDDFPVLRQIDQEGNQFDFVRTQKVLSHDYPRYLPSLNQYFSSYDFAGIITWHAGQNAPDAILTAHSTGDVNSGHFGSVHPQYMRNLLLAMEKFRITEELHDFKVTTEATHWSGVVYSSGSPELIPKFPAPVLDIEIGSSHQFWENTVAARVIASSLACVFTHDGLTVANLLCAGGVHFEPAFANAVFQTWNQHAFGISHILANQWLITGQYEDEDGQAKLEACVQSIRGGIAGIVIHDNLKGVYKDQFRILAAKYGIPVFKHQFLRRPEEISGLKSEM